MKESIKIYRGYANEHEIILFGHLFRDGIQNQYLWNKRRLNHAISVWRMFTLKTLPHVEITIQYDGTRYRTRTREDGYFRFVIPCTEKLSSGWHQETVLLDYKGIIEEMQVEFVKPDPGTFGLISDIDDTFLISHSNHLLQKLYVILARNVSKRKFFKDVLQHYKLLAHSNQKDSYDRRAFFYVSSSEWNLYNFIEQFTKLHDFPKAVIQLKKIKSGLLDFLNTGKGDHDHKLIKIKRILEYYPTIQFVLLGDDSQQDPDIYRRIVNHSPHQIKAIYIRQTGNQPKHGVGEMLHRIGQMNIPICYYKLSARAIDHSRSIGLIDNF